MSKAYLKTRRDLHEANQRASINSVCEKMARETGQDALAKTYAERGAVWRGSVRALETRLAKIAERITHKR